MAHTLKINRLAVDPSQDYHISLGYNRTRKPIPVPDMMKLDQNSTSIVFALPLPAPAEQNLSFNSFGLYVWCDKLTTIPSQWPKSIDGTSKYILQASIESGKPFLRSSPFVFRAYGFRATEFTLIPDVNCGLPFHYTGAWIFTLLPIEALKDENLLKYGVESASPWHMEVYFLPNHPIEPFKTHVPAEFLRKVVLSGSEMEAVNTSKIKAQSISPTAWWAAHTINWIWYHGFDGVGGKYIIYDRVGASDFNMTTNGHKPGGFDLAAWLTCSRNTCNCYDLSGITQLTLRLLGQKDESGTKLIIPAKWIYCTPMGFSQNCYLYGVKDPIRTAEPKLLNAPYLFAMETDVKERDLNSFHNHAWIEAQTVPKDLTYRVLDACTAKPPPNAPTFEGGIHTRAGYLAATIDNTVDRALCANYEADRNSYLAKVDTGAIPPAPGCTKFMYS